MLYGAVLEPGKPVTPQNELASVVHISQLCLDEPKENGKTYVQVKDGDLLYTLCVLEKGVSEMATVDVFFATNVVSLVTKGAKNKVHVVGYFEPDEATGFLSDSELDDDEFDEEDDEDEDEEGQDKLPKVEEYDEDDEEEEEEEEEEPAKAGKRKLPAKGKEAAGSKKNKVENDYEKALVDYLKANGKTTFATLGAKVKKPQGLNVKIGQFIKERPSKFKITGDSASLV